MTNDRATQIANVYSWCWQFAAAALKFATRNACKSNVSITSAQRAKCTIAAATAAYESILYSHVNPSAVRLLPVLFLPTIEANATQCCCCCNLTPRCLLNEIDAQVFISTTSTISTSVETSIFFFIFCLFVLQTACYGWNTTGFLSLGCCILVAPVKYLPQIPYCVSNYLNNIRTAAAARRRQHRIGGGIVFCFS